MIRQMPQFWKQDRRRRSDIHVVGHRKSQYARRIDGRPLPTVHVTDLRVRAPKGAPEPASRYLSPLLIEAMTRRARMRASASRPAWTWSAPQHDPRAGGRAMQAPVARMALAVLRCVSRIHASMTHPVKSHASG